MPPAVTSTDPSNGETGVAIDKIINITFSEAIQQGDYFNEIRLSSGGDTVSSATYVSGNSLTINPDTSLGYSTNYTVTIPTGSVKDLAGNALAGVYSISFTTNDIPDTTPPTVSASPAGGLYNAPQLVTLTASEPAVIYYTNDGSDPTTGSTQYTEAISINATATLKFMAVDQADNQSVKYMVTYTIDTDAPTISNTDPANGATNVPLNKVITITLSENIQTGGLYGDITLKDSKNKTVAITKNINNNLLTITPNTNLTKNTQYTVTIPAGSVQDIAGNSLLNNYTFVFTTVKK